MIDKSMWEVLWRNISDFYVNLRVGVAAVSRNRYGVEKTVDTHRILINAIDLIMLFNNMRQVLHVVPAKYNPHDLITVVWILVINREK
jgi:hypothetical protein